jgi:hypothetical protein
MINVFCSKLFLILFIIELIKDVYLFIILIYNKMNKIIFININTIMTDIDEDEELFDADKEMQILNENQDKLDREKIMKIPKTNTYLNSINAFVGKRGSDKIYSCFNELVRLNRY